MAHKPLATLLDDYERIARAAGHGPSKAADQAVRAARAAVNDAVLALEAALAAQGAGG